MEGSGLGQGRRKADTLDRESILELLNEINIAEDFVKEIVVNYKDGEDAYKNVMETYIKSIEKHLQEKEERYFLIAISK